MSTHADSYDWSVVLNKIVSKYRAMSLPVKAGLWFTLCEIIQRGLSVISMPIFTRLFSIDEYGSYSLYVTWVMLFGLVITLNIQQEVFNKGMSDHEYERPDYSTSQAVLITTLIVVFYLLYLLLQFPINAFTGMGTLLTSLMFIDIWTSAIVTLWLTRRRFEYAYKPLLTVTLGISIVSIAIGIVAVQLAPSGYKVLARVVSNLAPYLAATVVVMIDFLKHSQHCFDRDWWSASVKMGVPLTPHYASQVLLNQADKVLISWFLDNVKVAIYGVAHSAGLLLVMVSNGINSSLVPWLYSKLKSGDCRSIAGVTNAAALFVAVLVFILMLLAPECVAVLATGDYAEAIWCIPPIATGVVFTFLYTLFVNVEIYYGKAGYVATASVLSAVLNIVLNVIAIPLFGYIASAYVTAVCYMGTAMLHYLFMKKTLKSKGVGLRIYDARFLCFIGALTCLFAAISLVLYTLGPVRYAFVVALLFCIFACRNRLRSQFKSIRRKG